MAQGRGQSAGQSVDPSGERGKKNLMPRGTDGDTDAGARVGRRTSLPYPRALAKVIRPPAVSTWELEPPEMMTFNGSPLLDKLGGKYPRLEPPPSDGFE